MTLSEGKTSSEGRDLPPRSWMSMVNSRNGFFVGFFQSAVIHEIIGFVCAVGMLLIQFRHVPRIFDVWLSDETMYLGNGLSGERLMAFYEDSGLYSLIYRGLHVFLADPVDLYLWGGTAIIATCGIAIYVSIRIISGSQLCGIALMSGFVFSTALRVWPRPSYAAITVLAIGLSCAHFARSWVAKAAMLTLTAYLTTFIRSEYVVAFYLLGAIMIALAVSELVAALRIRRPTTLLRPELWPAWSAVGLFLLLIGFWSFPILRDSGRASVAFCQHYALRYVEANSLSINPWWNCREIVAQQFAGATTMREAFAVDPARILRFVSENALGELQVLRQFISQWFNPHSERPRAAIGVVLIIIGYVLLLPALWRKRRTILAPSGPGIAADLSAACILAIPPLISCIVVYPRLHYSILILFFSFVAVACFIRRYFGSISSALATLLVGLGLMLATPTLPVMAQPGVAVIELVRRQPGIKVMFEHDLGWCVYYRPRCRSLFPPFENRGADWFASLVQKEHPDAIMLTPLMLSLGGVEQDPVYRTLASEPSKLGYRAVSLPTGRTLLLRQAMDQSDK